jgi:uncharacterized membrane protein YkgB
MKPNSYKILQLSLVIIYIWFGVLKVLNSSPVAELIQKSLPAFPQSSFLLFLGLYEILAGVLLLHKKTLRIGVVMIWLQLAGIFLGAIINPFIYFQKGNPFLLNINGEFVIKNLVLLAASYYLWEKNK